MTEDSLESQWQRTLVLKAISPSGTKEEITLTVTLSSHGPELYLEEHKQRLEQICSTILNGSAPLASRLVEVSSTSKLPNP